MVALLLALAGCRTLRPQELERAARDETPVGTFLLEYAPVDEPVVPRVRAALEKAGARLARWGALREPVTVRILPSHAQLEDEAGREGYGWLRAWARYDELLVQSPRTWTLFGATQAQLEEALLHELTHCLMYQLAANRVTWRDKEIPRWFNEGMASWSADQGYRRQSLEDLSRWLARHPAREALYPSRARYRDDSERVYAAAHHAFGFLVRRYGEDAVRALLADMRRGSTFPQAFEFVVGLTPDAFAEDFARYVRLRGFRHGAPARRAPAEAVGTPADAGPRGAD